MSPSSFLGRDVPKIEIKHVGWLFPFQQSQSAKKSRGHIFSLDRWRPPPLLAPAFCPNGHTRLHCLGTCVRNTPSKFRFTCSERRNETQKQVPTKTRSNRQEKKNQTSTLRSGYVYVCILQDPRQYHGYDTERFHRRAEQGETIVHGRVYRRRRCRCRLLQKQTTFFPPISTAMMLAFVFGHLTAHARQTSYLRRTQEDKHALIRGLNNKINTRPALNSRTMKHLKGRHDPYTGTCAAFSSTSMPVALTPRHANTRLVSRCAPAPLSLPEA